LENKHQLLHSIWAFTNLQYFEETLILLEIPINSGNWKILENFKLQMAFGDANFYKITAEINRIIAEM